MSLFRLLPLILLFLVSSAQAGKQILRETYADHRNTSVEVESVFAPAARSGALPFRVTIQNNTAQDRVWNVRLSEGNRGRSLRTETNHRIEVKAGAKAEHEIILPFAPEFTAYSYRNLLVSITSPGLPEISRNEGYQTVQSLPTMAMSAKLASRSLARLNKTTKDQNSSNQRFAESFEPEDLPTTWIAYSGLDALLIDLPTWKGISEAQRRAVREWVRMGGHLDLFVSSKDSPGFTVNDLNFEGLLPLKGAESTARFSLGLVTIRDWDGRELETGLVSRFNSRPSRSATLDSDFDKSWNLADQFGTKEFNAVLIFFLLFLFAVLVAPVNLFYFAGPGKRHRLFITTPIISLAACLIVVLIIFVGDGIGGRGLRSAFADLQPNASEMRLYLTQEQISRTGVMLNQGFPSKRPILIEPVRLRDSPFNLLTQNRGQTTTYLFAGDQYRGGFFRSRSEQGFSVRTVEPTRARIERSGTEEASGAPKLTSSLPSAIESLLYRDERGKTWRSAPKQAIAPGGSIPLVPVPETEYRTLVNDMAKDFSDSLRTRIQFLNREKGRFFAQSNDSAGLLLDTHPGIDWETDSLLLSGNILAKPSTPEVDE